MWGYTFVPIKVALSEVPPFALAALRFLLAALPPCSSLGTRDALAQCRAYGVAIGVLQFGLLFLGIKLGMPAGLSSLVIQMQVFFTIGLAVLFAGDRLQRHNLIGAAIAAAGIVVLAVHKLASGASGTFIGFLLVHRARPSRGPSGNIIAKRGAGEHGADMFALVVWSSLVPPLPLAALSFAFEGGPAVLHAVGAMSAIAWGCVAGDVVRRDAVRLRLVERAAAPLSDGADLAVRAADPGIGSRERRAVSRRIAGAAAGARRRARFRRTRRQRIRRTSTSFSDTEVLNGRAPLASRPRKSCLRLHRSDALAPPPIGFAIVAASQRICVAGRVLARGDGSATPQARVGTPVADESELKDLRACRLHGQR